MGKRGSRDFSCGLWRIRHQAEMCSLRPIKAIGPSRHELIGTVGCGEMHGGSQSHTRQLCFGGGDWSGGRRRSWGFLSGATGQDRQEHEPASNSLCDLHTKLLRSPSRCLEPFQVRLNVIVLLNLDIRLNREANLFRGAGRDLAIGIHRTRFREPFLSHAASATVSPWAPPRGAVSTESHGLINGLTFC